MQKLLLLILGFLPLSLLGQDTWKVQFNDKQVLKTSDENAEKNIIHIPAGSLLKKKDFIITYAEGEKKKNWQRFLTIFNEQDVEVYRQSGNKIKIKNSALAALFKKSGTLKVYTWALPTDPKLQQTVRVRRVHLCTLVHRP